MTKDYKEDDIFRVKDGKLVKIDTPKSGYGKQTISWQHGKITTIEVSHTTK